MTEHKAPEPTAPLLDPRLDRRVEFDRRSEEFPIRALLTDLAVRSPRSYTWRLDTRLDQRNEGACVGFAWAHELAARPIVIAGITDQVGRDIYHEAQRLDAWEGGDYDGATPRYEGTSVLAGAKVIQGRRFMAEYRWGFSLEDAVAAIAWTGPVVFGLDWHEGMMTPEPDGRIRPTGARVGGHAIVGNQVVARRQRQRVWLTNSWGPGWGVSGRCYLTWDDLGTLLAQDGETCVPMQRARA